MDLLTVANAALRGRVKDKVPGDLVVAHKLREWRGEPIVFQCFSTNISPCCEGAADSPTDCPTVAPRAAVAALWAALRRCANSSTQSRPGAVGDENTVFSY